MLWGVCIAAYCAHIHSAGLQYSKQKGELSGQCMAAAGNIVPPSIKISEQISGVCISAIHGGGPAFGVMKRSAEFFFVIAEGQ